MLREIITAVVALAGLTSVAMAQENVQTHTALQNVPKKGDVIIRTLYPAESRPGRRGTLDAARIFGANRVEWIYDVNEAFVRKANSMGIEVGATMGYNAWPDVQQVTNWLGKFTSRDLWGNPVTRYNFRKFDDWQTRYFSPDSNILAWREFYTEYLKGIYRLPVIAVMRDDAGGVAALLNDGGSFTGDSVHMFQRYLKEKVSPETRRQLNINDPEQFDIRSFLIAEGAPKTEPADEQKKWQTWDGGPVMRLYAKAQREAVADFYRDVRSRVEAESGRRIPWSCNHTGQWGPIERNFDYALGEFYTHQMQIETLAEIARRAEQIGKVQCLQGVLDGRWEKRDPVELVDEMRRFIATSYALGMNPMVPWDMYMPGRAKRYHARVKDMADLFRWVRDNRRYFDDQETAWISCFNPQGSRQAWKFNQQIVRFPEEESPALRINAPDVLGVVRREGAAHVVHLVDWSRERKEFEVTLNLSALCESPAARVTLLRAGQPPCVLGDGTQCTFTVPALNPWGILVLEPLIRELEQPAPPVLLNPVRPVAAAGSPLRLAAGDGIVWVRQASPSSSEWRRFSEEITIDHDMTVEAKTVSESGAASPVARWRFWTVAQPAVKTVPSGKWRSLLSSFKSSDSHFKSFPDGAPLLFDGQEVSQGFCTVGAVELTAALPKSAVFFRIGIAVSDDAEVLRPSYRVEVYADERLLYETPIYNTVKGVVCGQESGRYDLQLALPEGVSAITLKLCKTGWFDGHNRVIWIDPQVLADKSLITDVNRFFADSIDQLIDTSKPLPAVKSCHVGVE